MKDLITRRNRGLFDEDFGFFREPFFRDLAGRLPKTNIDWNPSCDIDENDKEYHFRFDVPGMKKDDFHVELHENQLTVSGERKIEKNESENNKQYYERFHGSFSRSFTLPTTTDAERVEANYTDGVLDLKIPKADAAAKRRISIR